MIRADQNFQACRQQHFRPHQFPPLLNGNLGFDRGPKRRHHQHLEQAFIGPPHAVHTHRPGGLGPRRDPGSERNLVAALLLPLVQKRPRPPHELQRDFIALHFLAWLEMEPETHPVQFQAIEVVAFAVLFHQAEMVVADFLMQVVKRTVAPVEARTLFGPPLQAAKFGVRFPEIGMHVALRIINVMQIVHPHTDPG